MIGVTRRDLTPGYQATQISHSLIQYHYEHPVLSSEWYNNSKYLVFLSVESEKDLLDLALKFESEGIPYSMFREPDINNQVTSICALSDDELPLH